MPRDFASMDFQIQNKAVPFPFEQFTEKYSHDTKLTITIYSFIIREIGNEAGMLNLKMIKNKLGIPKRLRWGMLFQNIH